MGIPSCLWRRTGEIYKGNKEFAALGTSLSPSLLVFVARLTPFTPFPASSTLPSPPCSPLPRPLSRAWLSINTVGVPLEHLQGGKLAIYELMAEESAVNYWEKYGNVSRPFLPFPIPPILHADLPAFSRPFASLPPPFADRPPSSPSPQLTDACTQTHHRSPSTRARKPSSPPAS